MRLLLVELRPSSLPHTSLNTLLKHLCEAFRAKHNIPVKDTLTADDTANLPSEVKETFYRITQEVFNNIAKHAKASRIDVILEQTAAGIRLCIQDNGQGFDASRGQPEDRLGLQIMRERAAEINASLHIDSTRSAGTTIICEWKKPS